VQIKEFDVVELKDGREATILEIYENPPGYEIEDDTATDDPDYPNDAPLTFAVKPDEIKRVIWSAKD
jgi:hypothetical protein